MRIVCVLSAQRQVPRRRRRRSPFGTAASPPAATPAPPAAPPGGLSRILQTTRRESHGGKLPGSDAGSAGGGAGGFAANPPIFRRVVVRTTNNCTHACHAKSVACDMIFWRIRAWALRALALLPEYGGTIHPPSYLIAIMRIHWPRVRARRAERVGPVALGEPSVPRWAGPGALGGRTAGAACTWSTFPLRFGLRESGV